MTLQAYDRTRTKEEAKHLARSLRDSYAQVVVVPDRESYRFHWVIMVDGERDCQPTRQPSSRNER